MVEGGGNENNKKSMTGRNQGGPWSRNQRPDSRKPQGGVVDGRSQGSGQSLHTLGTDNRDNSGQGGIMGGAVRPESPGELRFRRDGAELVDLPTEMEEGIQNSRVGTPR